VVGGIRYSSALAWHRAQGAVQRIAADLELARHTARSRSQNVTVTFDLANHSYTITGVSNPNAPALPYQVSLNDSTYPAMLTTAGFNGDPILIFNAFGIPDSGGSIALQSGGVSKTVTVVAITGAVIIP
jgi:hypothetical protein